MTSELWNWIGPILTHLVAPCSEPTPTASVQNASARLIPYAPIMTHFCENTQIGINDITMQPTSPISVCMICLLRKCAES